MKEMNPKLPKSRNTETILIFLSRVTPSSKNYALLTEYFLHEFASAPQDFQLLLLKLKEKLKNGSESEKIFIAEIYLSIFSFLCERFGVYEEKLELDDACFAIQDNKNYTQLRQELERYQKKSQKIIDEIFHLFQEEIHIRNINASVKWRYKNIYSIYKNCGKENLRNVLSLNDIFAFRIIVEGKTKLCFEILNILHDKFIPIPKRYKDYISIPKINGYQSLHTGLLWLNSELDIGVEVQIRTKLMDDVAESGIAAHFLYAREKKSSMMTDKERKLIENMQKITASIRENPYVYCLTPKWDILRLEQGSNLSDFAHRIHSNIGKNAKYWLVNLEKQELRYMLQDFDSIQIITK
jgi:GTP diphosphokinase / guanosine-3',5'-bis(diphosphate) 3'-diphosphatase